MSAFKDAGVAFLTGFLQKTADDLKTQDKKAQDFYDLQLRLVETNAPKVKQNKSVIDNLLSVSNQIKGLGGSQEMINVAKASSPSGLTELRDKMLQAQKDYGVQWNPDFVQNVWGKIPDAVRETDAFKQYATLDSSEFFNQSYGQTGYEVGDFKAPEVGLFDRIKGKNKMAKVREELDQMDYADGMSIYDINQSANAAQYQSLIPGAYIQYPTIPPFTAKERNKIVDTRLPKAINDLDRNLKYVAAEDTLDDLRPQLLSNLALIKDQTTLNPLVNPSKIRDLQIGEKITWDTVRANDNVTREEFNNFLATETNYTGYNTKVGQYNNAMSIVKNLTNERIDTLVDSLVVDFGPRVINDESLRNILGNVAYYDVPPMIDDNGDAKTETTDQRRPSEIRKPITDFKVLGVDMLSENSFSVMIQAPMGKVETLTITDPNGPLRVVRGTDSLNMDDAVVLREKIGNLLSPEAIAKMIKDEKEKLPPVISGGESKVGKAKTKNITQVDLEQTALIQDLQKYIARDQFTFALNRIKTKVASGYDNQPAGSIIGGWKGYAFDDPKLAELRKNSQRASRWYSNVDKGTDEALEYFKQNPQQLIEAAKDPVAWYLRYEKQFKAESK
jgi:hypothetical protein|tara:strand:- start:2758 stop:4605 length:1848 start_codon:yes stop_codon:yes gene_type:complete